MSKELIFKWRRTYVELYGSECDWTCECHRKYISEDINEFYVLSVVDLLNDDVGSLVMKWDIRSQRVVWSDSENKRSVHVIEFEPIGTLLSVHTLIAKDYPSDRLVLDYPVQTSWIRALRYDEHVNRSLKRKSIGHVRNVDW